MSSVWGYGTLLCASAEQHVTVLEMHRSSYFSSFYLVGIPRSQPSSLPAAKRLIFADTNHHSCLWNENERGKKRGNHGKECRTRSLRDGQHPSFLLLVELNGQRAVIRTCLQTKNKQTPMSAPFTSTTIPLYFHLLLSSAKS